MCWWRPAGNPADKVSFTGLALSHGDIYFAQATWCNVVDLCTTVTSPSTQVDTVQPVVGGLYGSRYSVERNGTAPMRFQSFDDAAFTVTLAYDVDSAVRVMEAALQLVGSGADNASMQVRPVRRCCWGLLTAVLSCFGV
jgi:hypothetical protein